MGISERRQREKEQRKTEIIDAAERLFFSRGYEDVSMDDIAREVELNKATSISIMKIRRHCSQPLFSAVSGSLKKNTGNAGKKRLPALSK